jgi:hypothetical protein
MKQAHVANRVLLLEQVLLIECTDGDEAMEGLAEVLRSTMHNANCMRG